MDRLIVALDVETFAEASQLIDVLAPQVNYFKVGIAPFTAFGELLLNKLQALQKKVFLDLKFHDIPNTVKNATQAATKKGIAMMNFHCLGGERMLQAAVAGAHAAAIQPKPLLLGVTILTSMGGEDMQQLGLSGNMEEKVLSLATMAKTAKLDGVVASAKEVSMIKTQLGDDFVVVTPGIRPLWAVTSKEDQKRIVTPKQAVADGADYIVVGRPIVQAQDPLAAAEKILEELA